MYGKTVQGVIRSTFVIDAEGKVEEAQYNVRATGTSRSSARTEGLSSPPQASVRTVAVLRVGRSLDRDPRILWRDCRRLLIGGPAGAGVPQRQRDGF